MALLSSSSTKDGRGGGASKNNITGNGGGFFVSTRLAIFFLTFTTTLLFLHINTILKETTRVSTSFTTTTNNNAAVVTTATIPATGYINSVNQLRATMTSTTSTTTSAMMATTSDNNNQNDNNDSQQQPNQQPNNHQQQCTLYLAESAVGVDGQYSGMGIYTGIGLHPGDPIGVPDICLFVTDLNRPIKDWMHLRTHTFGRGSFFNQYEGTSSRAACEGLATNVNTMPQHLVNTQLISPYLATNGGLDRRTNNPGAGAITSNYGIHGQALDIITAGSELTIDYGDWDFDPSEAAKMQKPQRPVEWLQKHGWCIDNIDIKPSTLSHAGRGAFARKPLAANQIIAPAPLQVLPDRSVFTTTSRRNSSHVYVEEQLFVNYCFAPRNNSNYLLFPYGQGVGLINHASDRMGQQSQTSRLSGSSPTTKPQPKPNVKFQWSKHYMHHSAWLDLKSEEEFWHHVKPGGLIMEVVAVRDILVGEELFYDYGVEWETAWYQHVQSLSQSQMESRISNGDNDNDQYVYPFEMDETLPLRTVKEQIKDPYPSNLMTMCATPDWSSRRDRSKDDKPGQKAYHRNITWYDPILGSNSNGNGAAWWRYMTYCHVLDRQPGPYGDDVYTVQLVFKYHPGDDDNNNALKYDDTIPFEEMYVDENVPRRAIRFVDKPYQDDEHLPNAFRHPIGLPDDLYIPPIWENTAK